jgi:hypothetical protein
MAERMALGEVYGRPMNKWKDVEQYLKYRCAGSVAFAAV